MLFFSYNKNGQITNSVVMDGIIPAPDNLPEAHYVDISSSPHVVKPRPVMNILLDKPQVNASGADIATLSGLPDPCTISLEGEHYQSTGGSFEITFDLPGTYAIKVDSFPYLSASIEVVAV